MRKLKELSGREIKRIDGIRVAKYSLGFLLICYVVLFILPISEAEILKVFQSEECDPMIGTLFFEDYVWPDEAEIEIESIEIQMDKEHNFKEIRADEHNWKHFFTNYQTVIVQMTVCKVEEGKPQVRVLGNAVLTLKLKNRFLRRWHLFSLERTDERPVYSCLQAPEKPEDIKGELEDLLLNKQVEITKFTVNDAKNQIDVEYIKHIEGEMLESRDLYKRTFYYYGYSNTWVKEGSDQLLDREYLDDDIAGTYLCEYHDKELAIVLTKSDMINITYDDYKYIGNVESATYKTFSEIPKQDREIMLKYTDMDLSFSEPQCIISIKGGPNGAFKSLNTTEHQMIYFCIDRNEVSVCLPDEGNELKLYYLSKEDK